jgi:polyferredoxin
VSRNRGRWTGNLIWLAALVILLWVIIMYFSPLVK